MVKIKGLEKFAPKDFPAHISATVFLGGCNFRCPFCHNADLVLRPESLPTFPIDFFISFLDERKGWLEAVCITGGEPLLDEDLETLVRVIKDRQLLVKIDTNGSFPDRLEHLIREKIVDFIAMDIKAPLGKYERVVGRRVSEKNIQWSVDLIRSSGLAYMFRTTVVPGLIDFKEIREIGEWLRGAKLYQLQQFSPRNTIDPHYLHVRPYDRKDILKMAEIAREYFVEVRVEGI